jgi:hypothetical protein
MADKRENNTGIWIASLVLLVILGAGGYFAWQYVQSKEAKPPPVEVPKTEALDAGPAAVNLADGDALLKNGAGELSADEIFAKWMAEPDLVRRLVAATFAVSRGESPRELLTFLRPAGEFTVDEVEDKTQLAPKVKLTAKAKAKLAKSKKKRRPTKHLIRFYMSAASTARYDVVARVLDSVNVEKLGAIYAKLAPFAEAAFREAAPPGKTLEGVYGAAVDHLAAVPLTDERIELVEKEEGVDYAFKDPALESLTAAQKHLIRMGPANARIVVKKLQAFRSAVFAAQAPAASPDSGH